MAHLAYDTAETGLTPTRTRNYDKPFRDLPAEIRAIIWRYVLRIEIAVDIQAFHKEKPGCHILWPTNPYALLQVSKLVRTEAKAELNVNIVFKIAELRSSALQPAKVASTELLDSNSSLRKIAYPSMTSFNRKDAELHLYLLVQIIDWNWWKNDETESLYMHVDNHGRGVCKSDIQLLITLFSFATVGSGWHDGYHEAYSVFCNKKLKSWAPMRTSFRAGRLSYTVWETICRQTVRQPEDAGPPNLASLNNRRRRDRRWFNFGPFPTGQVNETWIWIDDEHSECRVMLPGKH